MLKKYLFISGLICFSLFFASCEDDDPIDNVDTTVSGKASLNFSASIINGSFQAGKAEMSSVDFNSGYVWIREIIFDAEVVGAGSVSKTIEKFSKIDFATGIADPVINNIEIPAGEYKSVNLGVELRDEDNKPAIWLEGTYTRTDGTSSPIQFKFNSGEVFEAEAESVTIESDADALAKIVFDPSVWFSNISAQRLDNASTNNDGIIIISESRNASIFDDVADRLDKSTQGSFE